VLSPVLNLVEARLDRS